MKIRSFGKEIMAQTVRDFVKFHSLIFHVETALVFGVVLAYSSRLFWHRVAHEYANVRRDASTAQFCTYTHITGLLAQAYSNELLAGSTRLWSRTPYLTNRYRLTRVRRPHVNSKQSYTTPHPPQNK